MINKNRKNAICVLNETETHAYEKAFVVLYISVPADYTWETKLPLESGIPVSIISQSNIQRDIEMGVPTYKCEKKLIEGIDYIIPQVKIGINGDHLQTYPNDTLKDNLSYR